MASSCSWIECPVAFGSSWKSKHNISSCAQMAWNSRKSCIEQLRCACWPCMVPNYSIRLLSVWSFSSCCGGTSDCWTSRWHCYYNRAAFSVSHFLLAWAIPSDRRISLITSPILSRNQNTYADSQMSHSRVNDALLHKRITGTVLNVENLKMIKDKRDLFYPLSLILHNTKPVGHQVTLPFSQI